jgi:uncharacterized Tic20 family protein
MYTIAGLRSLLSHPVDYVYVYTHALFTVYILRFVTLNKRSLYISGEEFVYPLQHNLTF